MCQLGLFGVFVRGTGDIAQSLVHLEQECIKKVEIMSLNHAMVCNQELTWEVINSI